MRAILVVLLMVLGLCLSCSKINEGGIKKAIKADIKSGLFFVGMRMHGAQQKEWVIEDVQFKVITKEIAERADLSKEMVGFAFGRAKVHPDLKGEGGIYHSFTVDLYYPNAEKKWIVEYENMSAVHGLCRMLLR